MPKKVLVVDDSATSRLLYRSIVSRGTSHTVLCAQDGNQALQMVETEKPDLVLMDVMMPGMSGLQVCKRLRMRKETSELPVVMLTFRTGEDSVHEGFESGCTAYLKKPVQEAELLQTLHRYLGE